ncbi:MAG: 6-phosphogluconolactonase [bacterium]|nr:6-phosphogluconolactonase [bacterium]
MSEAFVRTDDPFSVAAEILADVVEEIAEERGRARLALPGGSAAEAVPLAFALLRGRGFDFGRLALTWVDERCVPKASPDSNRGAQPFEPAPGYELPLFLDGETPPDAVARVAADLDERFAGGLDVTLLGMGGDGHVASLFVGRDWPSELVAHVADSPKPPPDRITLTRAVLNTARITLVVVAGEEKRDALVRLRAKDPALPACGLPGLVVVTDLDLSENS